MALIALVVTATISAVGALMTASLLVVPAATVRLWTSRLPAWQVATVLLVAIEGAAGLWLSVKLNAPPGATLAVLSGAAFACAALARVARARRALAVAAALAAALALGACGDDSSGSSATSVDAVATTTLAADWVREVGGDAGEGPRHPARQHRPARLRAETRGRRGGQQSRRRLQERRRVSTTGSTSWWTRAAATPSWST